MKSLKASYGTLWSLLVGLAAVLVLGLLIAQATKNGSPAGIGSLTPTLQPPSPSVIETPRPATLESSVLPVTETPGTGATPTAQETETAEAILTQKWIVFATWQWSLTENPIVQSPPSAGIFEGGGDVFYYPSQDVIILNNWQDMVNESGEWASVYAGSMYTDPAQGLVLVITPGPVVTYLTPIKAGAVRIVEVQNLHLVLLSENGTTFYFDVLGQRFVDSLTEVAPTVTPYRSSTPTPTETPLPTVTSLPTCTPGPTVSPTATPEAGTPPAMITCY